MKRFFSKNGIWLLAGVAVVVVTLCIISAVSSGTPFLRNAAGVAIGNCAIDASGDLVGVVTDAGLNWCTVTTVLDTTSSIGAQVFRTEQVAVAVGQLGLMSQGQLALTYLSDPESLISGDLVVTSGLGGYYPSGLVIGSVEELRTDVAGLTQYAVVTPKADINGLTQLFLITGFDIVE